MQSEVRLLVREVPVEQSWVYWIKVMKSDKEATLPGFCLC